MPDATPSLPIDEVPEEDREEVLPEQIMVGDYIYDPHWRRWVTVKNIALSTSGQITTRPWSTELIRMEYTFYYFAEEDWARGAGAPEHRQVTRRTRRATNLHNLSNTRAAIYKPPPPRHPRGATRGFPRAGE